MVGRESDLTNCDDGRLTDILGFLCLRHYLHHVLVSPHPGDDGKRG